ncbi:MAG: DUF6266 family protein [Bacteroidales bacterium]|nr:DUF6266 family protein [Bacteroidales bacterium]
MAKLEQGILGPFRGKVGTVVGYLWRGKHVVRAYRKEINYPNTEMQQAEREWFVGMVRFAATARQALLMGLRERAERDVMTEGNAFVRMNKSCFGRDAAWRVRSGMAPLRPAATSPCEGEERKNTISNQRYTTSYQEYATSNQEYTPSGCSPLQGELPEGVRGGIDYERIRIAEGAAAPVRFTTASVDENNVLHVDFERNSGMTRAKASDRVYVYVYNADTREGLLSAAAERRRGGVQTQLPEGWNERNVRVWGFVVDSEGRASASQYVAVDVMEDGDVAESPEGAFNEAGTLGQANKRKPLTGYNRDDGGGEPGY